MYNGHQGFSILILILYFFFCKKYFFMSIMLDIVNNHSIAVPSIIIKCYIVHNVFIQLIATKSYCF